MKQQLLTLTSLGFLAIAPLLGSAPRTPTIEAKQSQLSQSGTGKLQIRANGEDFVRQGFRSKDGWNISFDHLYVTLTEVAAYQSNPPYNPDAGGKIQATQKLIFNELKTVDLAAGDENADPILVREFTEAPAGHYNALSWRMVKATSEPTSGYSLVMKGTATRDSRQIDFAIAIDREYAYTCGEFVGENRKGILSPGGTADLEATFHFDHIFGDGDAPPNDDINTGALGFAPLADLASNGKLNVTLNDLQQRLSTRDYQTLAKTLVSLGHVGEGHCQQSPI